MHTEEKLSAEIGISAVTQHRVATWKRYVTIFGLKIFEVTNKVWYSHNGLKILSVDNSDHFVSRNLNPLLSVDFRTPHRYKNTYYAYSSCDSTWSFIYKGVITFASGTFVVWGSIWNTTGGWVEEI